jgi:hypothetical protein
MLEGYFWLFFWNEQTNFVEGTVHLKEHVSKKFFKGMQCKGNKLSLFVKCYVLGLINKTKLK